jgi:hypothetical protein
MANARFQEYVTSGTFTLTLSRNQVSALGLVANGEGRSVGLSDSVLERKGLVEPVADPAPRDMGRIEYRPTLAGFLCMDMLREAGLVNYGGNALAGELVALRKEIETRRLESATWREKAISAMSRKDRLQHDLDDANTEIERLRTSVRALESGITLRDRTSLIEPSSDFRPFRLRVKDPLPNATDTDLASA